MPDQITTVAQLSGYPLGAVFTDIEGGVWMIDSRNPATGACWMLSPETVRMSAKHVLRKWGPLTPVWRPDQAVGSPKVASKSDSLPSDPDAVGRYRKLPVTVEAIRYTPGTNCIAVAEFLGDDPGDLTCAEEADHEQTEYAIATPEGVMHASPGDYIIRGVHGEHYPCKGSIFEATYERADTPVIPGQNPTAEAVADALIKYETGGCCGFGTTCGLCDCGRSDQTAEQRREWDEHQLDRARAVLALIPPQRCAPSEAELSTVLIGCLGRDDYLSDTVRAITKLYSDQPTVAAVLKPIRELHAAGEPVCVETGHTPSRCPCSEVFCEGCGESMPCPTVRLLDEIESSAKGGE